MEQETQKVYYDNGKLWYEIPYLNGKRHGFIKGWYFNGQNWYETQYLSGKIHGLQKVWHENGKVYCETPYKHDLQCGAKIEFEY